MPRNQTPTPAEAVYNWRQVAGKNVYCHNPIGSEKCRFNVEGLNAASCSGGAKHGAEPAWQGGFDILGAAGQVLYRLIYCQDCGNTTRYTLGADEVWRCSVCKRPLT